MSIVSVNIPQIGEGLQEARLVAVLKQPGDFVKRDEPIYQMETDKAVMDVESPVEGILLEWLAEPDTILAIGAEVARMETSQGSQAVASTTPSQPDQVTESSAASQDSVVGLRIPMIGEGLQEARLVAVLKEPGEFVKRDEPIYQMETDKAVMDVESPYEGILLEWFAPVDTVLAIGAEVARMQVQGSVPAKTGGHHSPAAQDTASKVPSQMPSGSTSQTGPLRNAQISPRARQYAMEKGLSESDLRTLLSQHGTIQTSMIDSFLAGSQPKATSIPTTGVGGIYIEHPIPQKQRLLASRLVRGTQLVVPGTISVAVDWEPITALRAKYKETGGDFQPSTFTMFAFAVSKVIAKHQMFRSTMRGDEVLRTYEHVNLGIAVALPGDELVLAVVEGADTYNWNDFAKATRERIDLARGGKDQANESVTISLTNMQSFGLRDAVPVVVPPSVGTLFLGEVYRGLDQTSNEVKVKQYANIALTFDHRIINGVGAAEFVKEIKESIEQIGHLIQIS